MVKRREALAGLGSLLISGGVISTAASWTATSSATATLGVVYERPISLTPVDESLIHVITDSEGRVTAISLGGDGGVNQRAITRFEDLVRITNVGSVDVTSIYFSFDATSGELGRETLANVEAALAVTAGSETLSSGTGSDADLLAVTPDDAVESGVLGPGESVPFGVQVDLIADSGDSTLSDLPDVAYDVDLNVSVERAE